MTELHVTKVHAGREQFNEWRKNNPDVTPDLGGRDFSAHDLSGYDFSNANLERCRFNNTNFVGAKFCGANLTGTEFSKATLTKCDFKGSHLERTKFAEASLSKADFRGTAITKSPFVKSTLNETDFSGATIKECSFDDSGGESPIFCNSEFLSCQFSGVRYLSPDFSNSKCKGVSFTNADVSNANFEKADIQGSNFDNAQMPGVIFARTYIADSNMCRVVAIAGNMVSSRFQNVDLSFATLKNSDFTQCSLEKCNLSSADLSECNVQEANFYEADLSEAILRQVQNAPHARNLESTFIQKPARYFDTSKRDWREQWLDWEHIRYIGQVKLFAVSYSLLLYLITVFYLTGYYNEQVDIVRTWADEVITLNSSQDSSLQDAAVASLANQINTKVKRIAIGWSSLILFVSIFFLVVASAIYSFTCPDVIKNFTRAEWQYQLGRSLVHYWAYSWKGRKWRITCAALYALGGTSVFLVTLYKFGHVLWFVWKYAS